MPILVTGYSVKCPKSNNINELHYNLKNKIDMTSKSIRYPNNYNSLPPFTGTLPQINKFDHNHFNYNIKQVEKMDISIRLLLELTYEAILDARLSIDSLKGSNTGVYIGHCFSDYLGQIKMDENINGYELVNSCPSMAAGKVSYYFDFKGPSLVFDTACSSSLVALEKAFQDINNKVIDRAVVAGVSLTLDPRVSEMFNSYKMLSPDGKCFTFDSRANGYCRSEGIGVLIIESSRVRNYGYANIEGISVNSDGYTFKDITNPNYLSQIDVAEKTFLNFNIDKSNIQYIEAHGTGTKIGDEEELKSLTEIFNLSNNIPIGSIKSNLGHAEGASGILSIIKCLLMFEFMEIYPNLNFKSTNHQSIKENKFRVITEIQPLNKNPFVCISNYGFTGTNAFLVLSKGKTIFAHNPLPFQLHFTNNNNLINNSSNYVYDQYILGNNKHFKKTHFNDKIFNNKFSNITLLFPGQGSQIANMGKILIDKSSIFKDTLIRLSNVLDLDLISFYKNGDIWFLKNFSPIGIISYQIAMINILNSFGFSPNYIIGHSLGEISCAYFLNLITESQAILIANVRCKLVNLFQSNKNLLITSQKLNFPTFMRYDNDYVYLVDNSYIKEPDDILVCMKGKMFFTNADKEVINQLILDNNLDHTCIACFNSKNGYTISGTFNEANLLIRLLHENNNEVKIIDIDTNDIAYHSPILKYFKDYLNQAFFEILGDTKSKISDKFISTSKQNTFSYEYFTNNIINPVYFEENMCKISEQNIILEIASKSCLSQSIKSINNDINILQLLKNENVDILQFLIENCIPISKNIDYTIQEPIKYRILNIWDHSKEHRILEFNDFTNINNNKNYNNITFDLTREYSFLKDHIVDNDKVFPATGYFFILWKYNNFNTIEIRDIRILKKLKIDKISSIKFFIKTTLNFYEITFNNQIYASAYINHSNFHENFIIDFNKKNSIDGYEIYKYFRKYGYNYLDRFQGIESYDIANNSINIKENLHWISYFDTILQLVILSEKSSVLPTEFESIILSNYKKRNLLASLDKKVFGNSNIFISNYTNYNYYFKSKQNVTITSDTWLNYGNNTFDKINLLSQFFKNSIKSVTYSSDLDIDLQNIINLISDLKNDSNKKNLLIYTDQDLNNLDYDYIISKKELNLINYSLIITFDNIIFIYLKNLSNQKILKDWTKINNKDSQLWINNDISEGIIGSTKTLIKEGYNIRCHYLEDPKQKPNFINTEFTYQRLNKTCGIYLEGKYEPNIKYDKFNIFIDIPGSINTLKWESNNYSTKVEYSALNFRDIMRSYGKLREKDISLGLEFSGYNKNNKKIMGVGKNTLGNYCLSYYTYPVPENFSLKEASTITISYLTAYYCIIHKSNLKKGDNILIHAGSGAVGMACIHICLAKGINVFTTCSEHKKEFLIKHFGLNNHQIGNSRTLDFKKWILSETDYKGVDLVINSLSGKFQIESLKCVKEYGNFCEIGKYDIMKGSKLNQLLFEKNISFHVIDLLPIIKNKKFHSIFDNFLYNGFKNNEIKPLPITEFSTWKIIDAFRFMSQGKHIGKILINFNNSFKPDEIESNYTTEDNHLITGGTGSIGLELAIYLSKKGANKIYLLSRSNIKSNLQKFQLNQIECEFEIIIKDVCNVDFINSITTIWHLASTSNDCIFSNMNQKIWNEIYNVKVQGYLHLYNTFPDCKIVTFGSVASLHGNIGQSHYSFSNDCLKNYSRIHKNTYHIELGPIDNVGMAIRTLKNNKNLEFTGEYDFLDINLLFDCLDKFNFNKKNIAIYSLKSNIKENLQNSNLSNFNCIKDRIKMKLVELLGGTNDDYKDNVPLTSYGIDSLSTMELISFLKNEFVCDIRPQDINDTTDINSLYKNIKDSNKLEYNDIEYNENIEIQSEIINENIEIQQEIINENIEIQPEIINENDLTDFDEEINFLNDRYSIYKLWAKKNKWINDYINKSEN